MPKVPLTDRQQDVYDLIETLIFRRGYGPTVREIGEHFAIKSPNGVMCHLRALERKGLITRQANKSRAIELVGRMGRQTQPPRLVGTLSEQPVWIDLHSSEHLDVPSILPGQERLAVRISGDWLSQRGILDGDVVLIDQSDADDPESVEGKLVLASVPTGRAVLRYWHQAGKIVMLQSGHDEGESLVTPHATPIGVAVVVVRSLTHLPAAA